MLAFFLGASSSPTLSPVSELRGPGNRLGVVCVLQGCRALTKAGHWPGPDLEEAMNLSPIPVSLTEWQRPSVWVTIFGTYPCHTGGLREREGQLGPGCLAPSAMTRVSGPGPEGATD